MERLKKGMYVRCPFDHESQDDPRVFILGQIERVYRLENEVTVTFHDPHKIRKYYEDIPAKKKFSIDFVDHCPILENSKVVLRKSYLNGNIISTAYKKADGFYYYLIRLNDNGEKQIEEICESDFSVSFTRADYSPVKQLINYEFQNPYWYTRRNVVVDSLHALRNATYGFETLVGSRVFLLPHQVDTIVRAISESPCRFMLADEVGLGKTIEVAVIMKGLRDRLGKLNTLIIAPDSLVHQWQNELSYKFWLETPIWPNKSPRNDILIFPLENIDSEEGEYILSLDWDLCIVDETHRLLKMNEEYSAIYNLSHRLEHLLLLSATPIQQRRTEYLRLLSLLVPRRYGELSEGEFDELLERQARIRSNVHRLVRDIEDYEDLCEDYVDDLEEIAEVLRDNSFSALIENIDLNSEDSGLSAVKLALAYIGEHYQIERHILRHRRLELRDSMPSRQLELVTYPLAGTDFNFFELETYEMLVNYLDEHIQNNGSTNDTGSFVKLFLSAMFSSPWALREMLNARMQVLGKGSVNLNGKIHFDRSRQMQPFKEKIVSSVGTFKGESEQLQSLQDVSARWQAAVEDEFSRMDELYDDPDLIKGKLMKVLDYLSETLEESKYVIFTSWTETLTHLENLLITRFSQEAVVSFYSGKADKDLQEAADTFQSDPKCRFMICDELGGEGRNFQIAEEVLHVDLPWSPVELEQRIGRLDRIGREKDVTSVVFCSEETIESDLFNLWNKGLNIFGESLSGLEIALADIEGQILAGLSEDIKYGLGEILSNIGQHLQKMRADVEEERYFDMAKQLDSRVEEQLTKLINKFDERGGENLANTMLAWASSTGLNPRTMGKNNSIVAFSRDRLSINSMKNTMFVPPNMEKARARANWEQEIRGTFSRKLAIEKENLVFYAPGDPFFDSIVDNAAECSRGRSSALALKSDLDRGWRGIVFAWTSMVNPRPLLELGEDIQNLSLAQGYMPLGQIITAESISEGDKEVEDLALIQNMTQRLFIMEKDQVHLGRRGLKRDFLNIPGKYGCSNLDWFKANFPPDEWHKVVSASYERSLEKVRDKVNLEIDAQSAQADFQRRLDGLKAASLYYGVGDEFYVREHCRLKRVYQALLTGLKEPLFRLESAAFVWMVGKNE